MLSFLRHPSVVSRSSMQGAMSTVWIDGVGCFWLSLKDLVTIGGPGTPSAKLDDSRETTDLPLLSNLNRQHAAIIRTGEGYLLEAFGPVRVAGREVLGKSVLIDGVDIELGRNVRLRFRMPSPLCLSARLDFISDHRPAQSVDGVVLLADTCLLGPTDDHHVVCSDWPGQVLLVRQGHELTCRSRLSLTVNGQRLNSRQLLQSGDVITGDELRFRIEIPV